MDSQQCFGQNRWLSLFKRLTSLCKFVFSEEMLKHVLVYIVNKMCFTFQCYSVILLISITFVTCLLLYYLAPWQQRWQLKHIDKDYMNERVALLAYCFVNYCSTCCIESIHMCVSRETIKTIEPIRPLLWYYPNLKNRKEKDWAYIQ